VLLPAGDAWRRAWRLDPDLSLYGPDGFHPSRLGSILAALVIYGGLVSGNPSVSGEPTDATGSPAWAQALGVEAGVASTLERAVVEVRP
jgi:hypothetical protein